MATKNFAVKYPHLLDEWDYEANSVQPTDTTMGDKTKYTWKCINGHSWDSTILHRAYHNSGCKKCLDWDKRKELVLGSQKIIGLHSVVDVTCEKGHTFKIAAKDYVKAQTPCPYCGNRKLLKGFNGLNKVKPELAKELHPSMNNCKPDEVVYSSHKKVWWQCLKYEEHIWESTVSSRAIIGNGCVYCGNRKILKGYNDLKTTHPALCDEWDYEANYELKPEMFHSGSDKSVAWICSEGHKWSTKIVYRGLGRGCRQCAKFGFDDSKPSTLYFIYHKGFNAYKVGITNTGSRRIKRYENMGWETQYLVKHHEGTKIRNLETLMFRWIRKELNLPIFLSKPDMGNNGGWVETFSADEVSVQSVINKMTFLNSNYIK